MSPELESWRNAGRIEQVADTGYKLFIRELGDSNADANDTVMLIHGFPESSFSYHKVADGLLSQFRRMVMFDLLGYGFSDKPVTGCDFSLIQQADMALLLWRQMGITGGHIISHDMGTSVLTELLARQQLDLLPGWFDAGFKSVTFTNGSMVLSMAKLRLMQKLLLSRLGPSVNKLVNYKSFRASVLSAHGVALGEDEALEEVDIEDMWANCLENNGDKVNHLLIRYLLDRKRFEESRWLTALKSANGNLPIHLCWGDADQVARIEMARYLKQTVCPQAELSIMSGAGHFCQLGSPQLWLDNICKFFA